MLLIIKTNKYIKELSNKIVIIYITETSKTNLKEGDEIDYYYNGEYRKYIVKENFIISDTDWTSLENTEEDIITLITCVENEPNYRRCVQAQEYTKAKLIE